MSKRKNVVVEMSDGVVVGVYCPDQEYDVHVIDYDTAPSLVDQDDILREYYYDVENLTESLTQCL